MGQWTASSREPLNASVNWQAALKSHLNSHEPDLDTLQRVKTSCTLFAQDEAWSRRAKAAWGSGRLHPSDRAAITNWWQKMLQPWSTGNVPFQPEHVGRSRSTRARSSL